MSLALHGIGVSKGIAIGQLYLLRRDELEIPMRNLPPHLLQAETDRFRRAIHTAKNHLLAVRERIPPNASDDIAAFLDTHLLMLEDSNLVEVPQEIIRKQCCNAEWALKLQRDSLVAIFEQIEDPYLRARKDDVEQVVQRVLRILMNRESHPNEILDIRLRGRVIAAYDLTPADTILMQHQEIAGFITETGGPLSHTAILARGLGIPAVVGVLNLRQFIQDREFLIVDGEHGVIVASADERTLTYYRKRQNEDRFRSEQLHRLKHQAAITLDGHRITLSANIDLPEDIDRVKVYGADGIGLYRTEFLYLNRDDLPDEDEQFEVYREVIESMEGFPIIIRTLDIGGDKNLKKINNGSHPNSSPLGLRAIRLCLKNPSIFRPQLRAILRASAFGPISIMFPMLSNVQELKQSLDLLQIVKYELTEEGIPFASHLPIGGMIEVPAAAITASLFASYLDFMSIGTNDLIQYTLAIDRVDEEVNYLYDPLHPAVLQLIRLTIKAGQTAGIPVSMCGEMAGDILYTKLLLGMGLTHFSMQPSSILEVKKVILESDLSRLTQWINQLFDVDPGNSLYQLSQTSQWRAP